MKKTIVIEIICALLILLWFYTALSKLVEFEKFRYVLGTSPLISDYSDLVAYIIPVVEILISLLLVFPRARSIGLWTSLILLIIFTIYLIYMISFDKNLPCQCGGVISKMSWKQHIVFNIFFALLAYLGVWLRKNDIPKILISKKRSIL